MSAWDAIGLGLVLGFGWALGDALWFLLTRLLSPSIRAALALRKIKQIEAGRIERLDVKPGDRVILSMPGPLSADACDHIQRQWSEFAPDLGKLLIAFPDMKFSVVSRTDGTR